VARSERAGRRFFTRALPVLTITAAVLATAACGSSSSSPSSTGSGGASEKITLRLSWWGSDSRHKYTQDMIKMFEAQHPNITVQPDYSSFTDYWPKLATGIVGGQAADVIQQDVKYLRDYATRGAMADLTPFLGKEIASKDLDETATKSGEIDGKIYGIATGINAIGVVVDPAAFAKAGVAVPDDTKWTWDDLRTTAAAISKSAGKGFYGVQDPGQTDAVLEVYARQRGEQLYTADGKLGVSKETLTAYYTMLAGLLDSGAEPPASLSVEIGPSGPDKALVSTNTGAMSIFWSNQLAALTKAAGKDLKMLRLPGDSAQPGTFFKPAMYWSLNAKSKHPKEAAQLLDFLLNDSGAAKLTLSDRGLPVNLTNRTAIVPLLKPADKAAAEYLEKLKPTIAVTPPLPPKGSAKITSTVILNVNEQVLFKKLTPDQAADAFLTQAQAAIA
jgi:multiple sugar transport system substrate-binding protein